MTPPMSQNSVVISDKGAAPLIFASNSRLYHSMNENVKRYEIYGVSTRVFPSALLRMVSNCVRPDSAPPVRCNRITVFAGGQENRGHRVQARVAIVGDDGVLQGR